MKKILITYVTCAIGSQFAYMLILAVIYTSNIFYPESSELAYTFLEYITLSLAGILLAIQSGVIGTVVLYIISLIDKVILNKKILIFISGGIVMLGLWSENDIAVAVSLGIAVLFLIGAIYIDRFLQNRKNAAKI